MNAKPQPPASTSSVLSAIPLPDHENGIGIAHGGLAATLLTAEGKIIDAQGRVYAHGTATCMLFRDLTTEGA